MCTHAERAGVVSYTSDVPGVQAAKRSRAAEPVPAIVAHAHLHGRPARRHVPRAKSVDATLFPARRRGYRGSMHVSALFALAVVAAFITALVIGLAWFLAVPVAIVLLLAPLGYAFALFRGRGGRAPAGSEEAPSSQQASYDPVSDPSKPGTMRR